MTRRLIILAVTALAAWPVLTASAGGSARVWLQDTTPTVVRGAGFHARQVVVVTVSLGTDRLRGRATTNTAGSFVARFGSSVDAGCRSTFVAAVDASGRRAVLKIVPSGCGAQQGP